MVDRDRLVDIVSIGDIVKHRPWEMEQESAACATISGAPILRLARSTSS